MDLGRAPRVFRGFSAVPHQATPPLDRTLQWATQVSTPQAIGAAQNRLPPPAQPDEHAPARGVNSFAEFPVHVGVVGDAGDAGHTALQQWGLRMPVLSCLDLVLGSGLWIPVADRDVVSTAPGAPRKNT